MRKRSSRTSLFKKPMGKVIPISVALSLLSAGTAFAAVEKIQVDLGGGRGVAEFDAALMGTDANYAAAVKDILKNAFKAGDTIYVLDDAKGWIDFGSNAKEGMTYETMVDEIDNNESLKKGADIADTIATGIDGNGELVYQDRPY